MRKIGLLITVLMLFFNGCNSDYKDVKTYENYLNLISLFLVNDESFSENYKQYIHSLRKYEGDNAVNIEMIEMMNIIFFATRGIKLNKYNNDDYFKMFCELLVEYNYNKNTDSIGINCENKLINFIINYNISFLKSDIFFNTIDIYYISNNTVRYPAVLHSNVKYFIISEDADLLSKHQDSTTKIIKSELPINNNRYSYFFRCDDFFYYIIN